MIDTVVINQIFMRVKLALLGILSIGMIGYK